MNFEANHIVPAAPRPEQHQSPLQPQPQPQPCPNPISAFDLDLSAAIGLTSLWASHRVSWETKTEQLFGALMLLPIQSPLRDEIHFLMSLCWTLSRTTP
jgi:hypothetical protein